MKGVTVCSQWWRVLQVTMYLSGSLYLFNSRSVGWLHLSTTCGESGRPLTCWQYNPPYNYLRCNSCSDSCGWYRRGKEGVGTVMVHLLTLWQANSWAQHHSQQYSSTRKRCSESVPCISTTFRTSLPTEYCESYALFRRADWQKLQTFGGASGWNRSKNSCKIIKSRISTPPYPLISCLVFKVDVSYDVSSIKILQYPLCPLFLRWKKWVKFP